MRRKPRFPRQSISNVRAGSGVTRRDVLRAAGAVGLGLMLPGCGNDGEGTTSAPLIRMPGSLPDPSLPEGTDTLPQIEHVVTLMMENHSFDNYLGLLGSNVGFPLSGGKPIAANPDG
ncbi:MAG TPA: hypothetical protein VMT89_09750, partial [Candidatus Acidoferrales bacterium]|nr:hypothetical protein [Candidatus Acidoferrales bacterium]